MPRQGPPEPYALTLSPATIDVLERMAVDSGKTPSELVETLVEFQMLRDLTGIGHVLPAIQAKVGRRLT